MTQALGWKRPTRERRQCPGGRRLLLKGHLGIDLSSLSHNRLKGLGFLPFPQDICTLPAGAGGGKAEVKAPQSLESRFQAGGCLLG